MPLINRFSHGGNGVPDIPPGPITGLTIEKGNGELKLKWTDPEDANWDGTKVIRKEGSYPEGPQDGTVVIDSKVRNAYKTAALIDSGLTNETTYYYHVFPYFADGSCNTDVTGRISGVPSQYSVYTVRIDTANSNPETCITYADDAIGMTPESVAWDEFFGHYPVLFKNGSEVGKLNRNNFALFENGSGADITTGAAGDVMIAFPRRGLKITTNGDILTVSMTDAPDSPHFGYYAHSRGNTRKEKFYLGAYKGSSPLAGVIRSVSGGTIRDYTNIINFRSYARANGAGYELTGFYQRTFVQAMYLLKYKNLDSQSALGVGNVVEGSGWAKTGGTNSKGMDYGETTGKHQMKLFGIEDFWGNRGEFIDGVLTDEYFNILTSTTGFNDDGAGYTNHGHMASERINGYITKMYGSTEMGFIPKNFSGSTSTFFCDYADIDHSSCATAGVSYTGPSFVGAFVLAINVVKTGSSVGRVSRLMYL